MRKADNLPPSCAVVTKSGNLNFLEPSGPLQACNGTALPLPWCNPRVTCLCANLSIYKYSEITLNSRLSLHANTFLLNVLRLSLLACNRRTAGDGFSRILTSVFCGKLLKCFKFYLRLTLLTTIPYEEIMPFVPYILHTSRTLDIPVHPS